MATLLQCIDSLIEKITITDRQEDNIKSSLSNIETQLKKEESGLFITRTFTNGSYERDTIIRPLNDIDLFAVLDVSVWQDEFRQLPNPQSVLSKMRDYLNGLNDYKDKVSQDRPCVTIKLSDKDFDILPSFEMPNGGYYIPNYDLNSWTASYPERLTEDLEKAHKHYNYKIKQMIRVIKYWNRENGKVIPSYHIEEVAISISNLIQFENYEVNIRQWFNYAEIYLNGTKFKSIDEYNKTIEKIKKVKTKFAEAKTKLDEKKQSEAIQIWKEIFGKEFPTISIDEAKSFSSSLTNGTLKAASSGMISQTSGNSIASSKGYFGEIL